MDGMTISENTHHAASAFDRARFTLQKGRQERELCPPRRAERDGFASGPNSHGAWILRVVHASGPSAARAAPAER